MFVKYCCLKRNFSPCREQGRITHVFAYVVTGGGAGGDGFVTVAVDQGS